MNVAIVGGIKGIEREYKEIIRKHGIKCKLYNQLSPDFGKRIKNVDAMVVFTNTVSHKMTKTCCQICKKRNICLKRPHSSSINQLEETIMELKENLA